MGFLVEQNILEDVFQLCWGREKIKRIRKVRNKGKMKSFNDMCYEKLKKVPKGKVTTYGELARAVGRPGAARAVGNAMNKNPYAPKVPCHRVVGANGGMTGFASGISNKVKMLNAEGVEVKAGRVDLEKFGFRF